MLLLKESEALITDKIGKQKKETEQIISVVTKLWPLLMKTCQDNILSVDAQSREVLVKLGQILNKDVSQLTNPNIQRIEQYEAQQQQNVLEMLKKETEFLRTEIAKERRESEIVRKRLEMSNMKCDLIFQEMFKQIEEGDRVSAIIAESASSDIGCSSSLAKLTHLEFSLKTLTEDEELLCQWKSKVFDMIDKIEHFEEHYLDQHLKLIDHSQKIQSKGDLSLTTPTPAFDGESGAKSASRINPTTQALNQRRSTQPVVAGGTFQGPEGNANMTNVSLPDISSTEIAPNKLSIPSKILNINHVRGLQFYQK